MDMTPAFAAIPVPVIVETNETPLISVKFAQIPAEVSSFFVL